MDYLAMMLLGFIMGFVLCIMSFEKYVLEKYKQKSQMEIDGKIYQVIEIVDDNEKKE